MHVAGFRAAANETPRRNSETPAGPLRKGETMAFDFSRFTDPPLDEEFVLHLLEDELPLRALEFQRLWSYYRNDIDGLAVGVANTTEGDWSEVGRPYTQEQEWGLPARITGRPVLAAAAAGASGERLRRKEVVVENDIAWRIDTGVHFLFGKAPFVESLAADPARARQIEAALATVLEANGGVAFLQELALLGSIYGFVDVLVRPPEVARLDGRWVCGNPEPADGSSHPGAGDVLEEVNPLEHVRLEPVEAWRAIPVLDEDDCRKVQFYVVHYRKLLNRARAAGSAARLIDWAREAALGLSPYGQGGREPESTLVTEILGRRWWQVYESGRLAAEGPNLLHEVPLVHVQNLPLPGLYEGAGDVAPLVPLQDELNTRLSDRAHRVTFQSFKMYLGRGIENFENRPVAPGRMWATDNPEASIEEFGGDADSPSEEAHIAQLREALDKASGITPLAAGVLRDRLGNLTSAAALRVTLMGTLARIERKRVTYGEGLARLNRMVLSLLDRTGIFPNRPDERATRLRWPSPLPENERESLEQSRL